jgi:hypothetical protein
MTQVEPEIERSLRRYVLGSLEEDARLQIEEKLVQDPDTFELLGVIEDELAEEYLDGTLTEPERVAYEQHDHQHDLEFFSALRARASAAPPEPSRAPGWDPASWLKGMVFQPAWLGAAAALLVATLVGSAWLVRQPVPSAAISPAVPTYALASGLLRSGGTLTRVAVPADADGVRLLLDLPSDDYALYRAALLDVDGDEIWSQSNLRAESTEEQVVVAVLVPASVLVHGDYQMKVSGVTKSGELEALASYTFRALPD